VRSVVVAIGGPSGAGKSTLTAALAERFGWSPLDEAYYRLRPRPSLRIGSRRALVTLERQLLAEEARRYQEAQRLAREGRLVVADTGFLDPVTYTAALYALGIADRASFRDVVVRARALARRGELGAPDLTVHLVVPAPVRRTRVLADPKGHPRAFRARHEAVGQLDDRLLLPWIARRFPGRVRLLPAVSSVETLARRVHAAAGRARPLRDPCAAAERLLATLDRLPMRPPALGAAGNLKSGTRSSRGPR
jgi:thymidylate kinase